jgi:two-component system, cell cycle response regulator DivK
MQKKTVLIVEDHFETLAINRVYLEHHGYRVVAAADGFSGVRSAREHRPDLILMDLSIPGLDGFAATAQIKGDPDTRNIPVVAITAFSYGSAGRRAREAGCDGFVAKPCDPGRLLAEVRDHIGPAEMH